MIRYQASTQYNGKRGLRHWSLPESSFRTIFKEFYFKDLNSNVIGNTTQNCQNDARKSIDVEKVSKLGRSQLCEILDSTVKDKIAAIEKFKYRKFNSNVLTQNHERQHQHPSTKIELKWNNSSRGNLQSQIKTCFGATNHVRVCVCVWYISKASHQHKKPQQSFFFN